MNRPVSSELEPRTGPERESAQQLRAAWLSELLATAAESAQRMATQQAERQASSEYAARVEAGAQTQAEARQQAQARDDVELELLCRSLSAVLDNPANAWTCLIAQLSSISAMPT
jgi:hypothetical protein